MLPMAWLWILLRCLFPADPIRQTAEAMRHRVKQLIHISQDKAQLAELLVNPAKDCLRLWIAMRGHQIARIRPKLPRDRATSNLTRAKDLVHLLARIAALAHDCDHMEQRAQSHAQKLKRLREADPLGSHGSPGDLNDAAPSAAAHHELVGVGTSSNSSIALILSSACSARPSKDERVLTTRASMRGPPHSIAGANP